MVIAEDDFDELACAGLKVGETVADYDGRLAAWRSADMLMHCLNLQVPMQTSLLWCATECYWSTQRNLKIWVRR